MEVGTGRGVAAGSGRVVDVTSTGGAGVTNSLVATGVSVTAAGSVERAEACVGAGVAVDIGAEVTAVGGVDPEHAVRTNSVRKTNPPAGVSCMFPWETSFSTVATAELYRNDGASIEDVGALLGHRSIATTATYLARMEGEEDNGWEGVATALGA